MTEWSEFLLQTLVTCKILLHYHIIEIYIEHAQDAKKMTTLKYTVLDGIHRIFK